MPKISIHLNEVNLSRYKEKVGTILRQPAPSGDIDTLTLNYNLDLVPISMDVIWAIRALTEIVQDSSVGLDVHGLEDKDVFLFMEAGRAINDLMTVYKGRAIFGE